MALVPALVILGFDAWLVRQRALASLTELSTKVVRLMQRELDDRITRGAHRLDVLAADPDVIALSPAATRKLVDAMRDDRLYNNVFIADGTTAEVRASAVPLDWPATARDLLAFQLARKTLDFTTGAFLSEPATHKPGLNLGAPVVNELGAVTSVALASLDLEWVRAFIERSGFPPSTVLTVVDDRDIVQYRSADLDRFVENLRARTPPRCAARPTARLKPPDSMASTVCTLPRHWIPRSAHGQPGQPRDSTWSLSRRHEPRAPPQPRNPGGRHAGVFPDGLARRPGAVPAGGPSDPGYRAQGLGWRPRRANGSVGDPRRAPGARTGD